MARFAIAGLTAWVALTLGLSAGWSQTPTISELAVDSGAANRTERLIAGAKKEKVVVVYGSTVAEDMRPVSDAFRKRYGLDLQYWRASSEQLVQRAVNENRAGRCVADVFTTVAAELETLHRENLLIAVKTPATAELAPLAFRPHGEWVATRLNIFSASYNTNLVKREEVPRSYEDLRSPRWKGRLAVEAADFDWFGTVVMKMGEKKGLELFRDIVRTNGMSVRRGHTLLANLVQAGEVPLALTVYHYKPEQQKREGAPVEPLYLRPLVALGYGPAVSRCAPHPHAALLFFDFMIREGQEIMAKRDMTPTNPRIKPLPEGFDLTLIDPAEMLDNRKKWDDLWTSIVLKPR
ncbi:MAG: ABC transporter substrate-binding protein [Hyphomicrobiales bacterium]|nr:ABC transporter substrate-binding protein [Hyphomicrobiales bacterium]